MKKSQNSKVKTQKSGLRESSQRSKVGDVFQIINLEQIPNIIDVVDPITNKYYFVYISNKDLEKEIIVNLNSKNSKVFLKGAIYLFGNAKCNLKVIVNHKIGKNKARVNIKTVLSGNSNFNFEGMINIFPKAHKANSYLKQNNLLVSKNAVCNTSPQLEIKADDVKASHGATISGFDPDELFYLQSRSISEKLCEQILEESFLATVFGKNLPAVLLALNIPKIIPI